MGALLAVTGDLDISNASLGDLQQALIRGETTSSALTRAYLARIEAYDRAGWNLNSVREIVSDSALLDSATAQLCAMGGIPARMGNQLRGLQDKERSGVLSTVGRHLAFLSARTSMTEPASIV